MRFTLAEQNGVPANVQIATALVQILAWFGVAFGVPSCISGVLSPVAFFVDCSLSRWLLSSSRRWKGCGSEGAGPDAW